MEKIILFMDNNQDFLDVQARLLERMGYGVLRALTIEGAERMLKEKRVHLAILDIRMLEENDEYDISGLLLAQKEEYKLLPKIILTAYPSYEYVREVLGPGPEGLPPAVNFLAKEEGPEALITAIEKAFALHVRINWDLHIEWKARDCFSLVRLIEPGPEGERLPNRAEELEDLFRRLFYEKEHIRVERKLWHTNGRVALVVFAFKEDAKPESFVVVCGQNAIVNEEAQRFEEFAPKASGESGTMLSMKAETTHFAANAYTVAGNDLEKAPTLDDHYHSASEKAFNESLTMLFQQTLQEWHQDKPVVEKNNSLESLYHQHLQLTKEHFSNVDFEERIKVIMSQIATLGSRIARTDEVLTFQLNNQSFSFPDPLLIFSQTPDQKEGIVTITVPGILSGESILTDESGHAWLTDFADAGLAPNYWNFVALEAAIRFDWTETNDLLRRYELENCLLNTEFAKPDTRDLEPMIRKPARAIQTIRKLAARTVGNDVMAYHHGIFFQAVRRLADFNPANPMTSKELARLGHIMLSMAMIARKLEQNKVDGPLVRVPIQSDQITIVDEKARIVMIGDRKERLAPQPFEVFRHLYLHANEVCSKEELLKVALKGDYDERNLHTLISRIRKVIEEDPEHPIYLITEPNAGYRLIPKPAS